MSRQGQYCALWLRLGLGVLCVCQARALPRMLHEAAVTEAANPPIDIWTTGPILQAVNRRQLYPDSKTFVDKPLRLGYSQAEVAAAFEDAQKSIGDFDTEALQQFVDKYFAEPGSDLDNFTSPDFLDQPPDFLPLVQDKTILDWGYNVHRLWKVLARKESASVVADPEKHSLLVLPNPAVIAGDRFREVYYWDSFFIIQGLLVSGMKTTAMDVIRNLTHLLKTYGFIPNGARTYYLDRSQPPLLSEMIRVVYEATQDKAFLEEQYSYLEQEHTYWTKEPRQVSVVKNGIAYKLSRYWSTRRTPRPESYREDLATAEGLSSEEAAELWHNLASAASSGWDFSSRWFKDGQNLTSCQTTAYLPTDLNSFLFKMEVNLAKFAKILGKDDKLHRKAAAARKEAINALMWNETTDQWQDLLIKNINADFVVSDYDQQQRTYVSNWIPLWAGLFKPQSTNAVAACESFACSGLIQAGGTLTSLYNSSQQWDAPNAWPPLQYFMIEGLREFGGEEAQKLSLQMAQSWLESNYAGYQQDNGKMIEKYNGMAPGVVGGGGEYGVQIGFGWTNGVMLHFLHKFGWDPAKSLKGGPFKDVFGDESSD